MSKGNRAQQILLDELSLLVTARLALILLPVLEHLREKGSQRLADCVVDLGLHDIELNLSHILKSYEVRAKEKERSCN